MKTSNDPRHQARRLAISIIYSKETTSELKNAHTEPDIEKTIIDNLGIKKYDKELYRKIIHGVFSNHSELEETIKKSSKEWAIEKIYKIDKSILLIAIWELKNKTAPTKVIIDEAVELAKEFGEEDSSRFVNGILSGVLKSL